MDTSPIREIKLKKIEQVALAYVNRINTVAKSEIITFDLIISDLTNRTFISILEQGITNLPNNHGCSFEVQLFQRRTTYFNNNSHVFLFVYYFLTVSRNPEAVEIARRAVKLCKLLKIVKFLLRHFANAVDCCDHCNSVFMKALMANELDYTAGDLHYRVGIDTVKTVNKNDKNIKKEKK